MLRFQLLPLLISTALYGADGAAAVARQLHSAELNESECFRVRDLAFQRDEAKFYLTEGHLIFSKPVGGRRFAAVFTADVPGGDAEIILLPPHKSERMSLAALAKTPNLNEHFNSALFLFTDGSGEDWLKQILESPSVKREAESGLLLKSTFESVLRNLTSSYEVRLVRDLLLPESADKGFLYAMLSGRQLGNFDVLYDPRAREQLVAGQLAFRNERQYFDIWTSFESRSFRNGRKKAAVTSLFIPDITIEATVDKDLHLTAKTKMTLAPKEAAERVLAFDISRRMRITEARLDGVPVEVFSRESLRASLMKGGDNEALLVVAPEPLQAHRTYTLEFTHEGDVISKAGDGIYYVGSRGSWYPNSDIGFSKYDLTFRYPKTLGLVATGDVVGERTEGEWRITHRSTQVPIRFVGFNLGNYDKAAVSRSGYTVEVYANKHVEDALRPRPIDPVFVPPNRGAVRRLGETAVSSIELAPNPGARLQQLASEIGATMEFMASNFGPPPLKTLTVSPIPGTFGQGFPGLLYLSTLSYLSPGERPLRSESLQTFFSELLHAHETAHQWWGNLVITTSYQDEWLMESLANYSAILMLERKKGRKAVDAVLDSYRDHLLAKDDGGKTIESAGPIVWGLRLVNSHSPASWRTITYEKGTWIIHMLRMQMGDERFLKMLGELARRKAFQTVTTEEFRKLAAEFQPAKSEDPNLESFFEQWVYGTGIPTLKMQYTVTGKAPKLRVQGTVTASDVDDDFAGRAPVEVQLAGKKTVVKWVRMSAEPTPFSIDVTLPPGKVLLDPGHSVLAKH